MVNIVFKEHKIRHSVDYCHLNDDFKKDLVKDRAVYHYLRFDKANSEILIHHIFWPSANAT